MVQKCFAYVVLASMISLQVIAAPTPDDPINPPMCIDTTISWQERLKVCDPCQRPGITGIPASVRNQRCMGDGPDTHERANGIYRRLPLEAVTKGHWIETRHKTNDIYARQEMPTGTHNDGAANGIVEDQASANYDSVTHKPASGVWRKRGTLPVGAIVHQQASDVSEGGDEPLAGRKRDSNPVSSLQGQSNANSLNDVIIHNPATRVWRKRDIRPIISLPSGPIAHQQASDVSNGGEKPPAGSKRDISSVGSLEGQSRANAPNDVIIHNPVSGVWRKRGLIPLGAIVHEQASDVSDGGNPPLIERKREALAEDDTPIEGAAPVPRPHVLPRQSSDQESTPSAAPQTTSEAPAPETSAGTTQEDNSIQAAADRFTSLYHYTPPHWTPAIVHEVANDIHRREERVQAREWVG